MLPENPSTGYQWDMDVSEGLGIWDLGLVTDESIGELHTWALQATGSGYQEVNGVYKRPWKEATRYDPIYNLNIRIIPAALDD